MSDMPFFPGGGGGGGGGTTDYDALSNKPVVNLTGSPVVITALSTGVYNIEGTWAMTPDSDPVNTLKDDLFYVANDGAECKLTWITAGGIMTYSSPTDGTKDDVQTDTIATTEEVIESLVSDF